MPPRVITPVQEYWKRRWQLIVTRPGGTTSSTGISEAGGPPPIVPASVLVEGRGTDLSQFRFTFRTQQTDGHTPNNVHIRVYNLDRDTVNKVKGEYDKVYLHAGYEHGPYG